jgi:hypothetical protein
MEQINEAVKAFDSKADSLIKNIEKPTVVRGIIILLLSLYAAHIAPKPPAQIIKLFDNVYFKLFVFSLILWSAQFSPSISILIAIGFLVTNNYATTGKLWETMDGSVTSADATPAVAATSATNVLNAQLANSPVVNGVTTTASTVTITPTIVQTPNGPAVSNPNVVIAPAVVSSPSGEQILVQPNVSMITPAPSGTESVAPAPVAPVAPAVSQQDAVNAVIQLSQAASSPVPSDVEAVQQVAVVAMSAVSTEAGAAAVTALGQQAVVAQAGEPAKVQQAANEAIASITNAQWSSGEADKQMWQANYDKQQGLSCYPMRNYDLSKVFGQKDGGESLEDYASFSK